MEEEAVTEEEAVALKRFKGVILARGYHYPQRGDDHTLLRFLRARALDIRKAAQIYGDYVKWRRDNHIDSLLQTFAFPELDAVLAAWPQNWHKTDRFGRPINIQLISRLRIQEVFHATTEERLLKRALWVWEELHEVKLPACSKAAGHQVGRATIIVDLKDIPLGTLTNAHGRRVLIKMAQIFSRYYPEYLGRLIIVNAPAAFKVLWEILLPFIDAPTQKRIGIHRGNGLADLLSVVAPENLPCFLGGSCKCPQGCENSLTGPWSDKVDAQQRM
ncbi:hypothetical protein SELMODRAFT_92905 [Selaginella moellendorffii]|uniref:CRAL-TRIO domain-containing protein n=1 Tax=Selaginella moellendorffii TaxID=88036 RepID=D8RF01_SELML|nr:phosphatidylinositol/phosphatidylcholine transfer protein SFH11 isoform X1 [Selaginella moellendorffii]EFJ28786.1 hypothetical protein SELMODRAFT_92905 [Selaginella moellendorffii]|eukprot:XP_002969662.1 phosphatidylinositol/phosphatidylcholine transfer protein SFH11 isoform X1 [Selaginella moellendorffii]